MNRENTVRRLCQTSMLAALLVALREILQFMPNMKPIAPTVALVSMFLGIGWAVYLIVTVVIIGGFCFGFGTFIIFQILGFTVIALLAFSLRRLLGKLWRFLLLMAVSGYIFGFIVSLDRLLIMNLRGFMLYYIGGLGFDTLSAAGNVLFGAVMYYPLKKIFEKETG